MLFRPEQHYRSFLKYIGISRHHSTTLSWGSRMTTARGLSEAHIRSGKVLEGIKGHPRRCKHEGPVCVQILLCRYLGTIHPSKKKTMPVQV